MSDSNIDIGSIKHVLFDRMVQLWLNNANWMYGSQSTVNNDVCPSTQESLSAPILYY